MARRIFKSGNSLVVSLPEEMLSFYKLGAGAEVVIENDQEHGGILLKPVAQSVPGVDAEFARMVSGFVERYRPALEALAKNERDVADRSTDPLHS